MKKLRAIRSLPTSLMRMACIFIGFSTGTVHASNWTSSSGGDFGNASNWNAGVPGTTDTAVFNLSSNYTVGFYPGYDGDGFPLFTGDQTNRELVVQNDTVTLDLEFYSTYSLTGSIGTTIGKSITVGANNGDVGVLTVQNGAMISTSSTATINGIVLGDAAGSDGTLTLSYGSYLDATGDFRVGRFGTGSFNIMNGGYAGTSGGDAIIADRSGSIGNVLIDNSTWNHDGTMRVGSSGQGQIDIQNGGTLSTGFLSVADNGVGDVLVPGSGSSLSTSSSLGIGFNGSGSLTIDQGGSVTVTGSTSLATNETSTATVLVDGPTSTMDVSGARLDIGLLGSADMSIVNGASVAVNGEVYFGGAQNTTTGERGSGTVLVSGLGSSFTATQSLNLISGSLTIENGASASTGNFTSIGWSGTVTPPPSLVVDGSGSQWLNTGTFRVAGDGSVTVQNGGLVSTTSACIGGVSCGATGPGTLTMENGALVINEPVATGLEVGSQGTINVNNGTIITPTNAPGILNEGTMNLTNSQITSNLVNTSTIDVDGAGITTIAGNLTNNGNIKTTGTTLEVTGTFTNNGAYVSDPSDNMFGDLIIGSDGYLIGGQGDRFIVNGDFTNNSTQAALWDTNSATLIFDVAGVHNFTVASADLGIDGAAHNFNWGALQPGSGVSLNILDDHGDGAALYVGLLDLADGISQISSINSAYNIYYDETLPGNSYLNGQTLSLDNGALLTPGTFPAAVPISPTIWLFSSGLFGLIGIARRKKAA